MHYLNGQSENFAKLYGFSAAESFKIYMKYYKLGSLANFLGNHRNPSRQLIVDFASDISRALEVMHRLGFAHCDIKADNILLDKNDQRFFCVLTDLGISRVVSNETLGVNHFKPKQIIGMSIQYAAPELIELFFQKTDKIEKKADSRIASTVLSADVYAFSIVLYQSLNCKLNPWASSTMNF